MAHLAASLGEVGFTTLKIFLDTIWTIFRLDLHRYFALQETFELLFFLLDFKSFDIRVCYIFQISVYSQSNIRNILSSPCFRVWVEAFFGILPSAFYLYDLFILSYGLHLVLAFSVANSMHIPLLKTSWSCITFCSFMQCHSTASILSFYSFNSVLYLFFYSLWSCEINYFYILLADIFMTYSIDITCM